MTCEFKDCKDQKFPGALPYCSFHTELTLWWDLLVRLTNDQDICIFNPLGTIVSPSYIYRLDSIDNADSLDPKSFDIYNVETYFDDYKDDVKGALEDAYRSISEPNIFQLESFYIPPINVKRKIEVVMMSVFQQLVNITIDELTTGGPIDVDKAESIIDELGGFDKLVKLYKPTHIGNHNMFSGVYDVINEYFNELGVDYDAGDISILLNAYIMRTLIPKYIDRFNKISPVPFFTSSDKFHHFDGYHEYNYKRFIG
jgi:hypothetical protein